MLWYGWKYHIKKETAYTQRDEEKRKIHLDNISKIDSDKIVFIDETGTDDNICALYGYSEIGTRSYSTKNAFKKQRLSTIAGYRSSTKDLIAPFEYSGTANKDLFLGWFEKVWGNFKNILRRIRHKYDDFKDAIQAAWNWR